MEGGTTTDRHAADTVEAATAKATNGAPVPDRMAHVVLYTARYDQIRDWYRTVFNARIVLERPGAQVFMTFDDEHHRILVSHKPGWVDRPENAVGIAHIAWTYRNLGDLFATYDRLKAAGIEPEFTVNHGMTTSLYYLDPDSNRVELQVENFDDPMIPMALVEQDTYRNMPFDPDKMSAAVKAGTPQDTLRSPENVRAMVEAGEL